MKNYIIEVLEVTANVKDPYLTVRVMVSCLGLELVKIVQWTDEELDEHLDDGYFWSERNLDFEYIFD